MKIYWKMKGMRCKEIVTQMRASLGAGVVVWVYLDWAVGLHGVWFNI